VGHRYCTAAVARCQIFSEFAGEEKKSGSWIGIKVNKGKESKRECRT